MVVGTDQADLSLLLTEITKLANDLACSGLRETELKDLKLPEDSELKLSLKKTDKVMKKVKVFLDSWDEFLQPLASMSPIASSFYGGLKCIVTVSESLDGTPTCRRHIPIITTDSCCQSGDSRR